MCITVTLNWRWREEFAKEFGAMLHVPSLAANYSAWEREVIRERFLV